MNSLNVHTYLARQSPVTATQVTADNLTAVADWTGGVAHVHTRTHNCSVSIPPSDMPAMVSDWVLRSTGGQFAVLTNRDFQDRYQRSSLLASRWSDR